MNVTRFKSPAHLPGGRVAILSALCIGAAAVFLYNYDGTLWGHLDPLPEASVVDYSFIDPHPPRETYGSLVMIDEDGEEMGCSDCHEEGDDPFVENPEKSVDEPHEKIVMDHGHNKRCFNCHNPSDRDTFIDYDDKVMVFKDEVLLCKKCHGEEYDNWLLGSHGRRSGYWDTERGEQTILACVNCHDPHQPRIKKLKSAPPPQKSH